MANANVLRESELQASIIDTLGEMGQMTPQDLAARTGQQGKDLALRVRGLKERGDIFISGGSCGLTDSAQADWDSVNKPVAAKPSKPAESALPSKPTRVPPAVKAESLPELDYEPDGEDDAEEPDVDDLIREYNALQAKKRKTKSDIKRYEQLEERLDELGVFEDSEPDAEAEGEPEDNLDFGAEGDEDELDFGTDSDDTEGDDGADDHDADNDDEGEFGDDLDESEPVAPVAAKPAKPNSKTSLPKTAAVSAEAHEVFSMSFKPIDTLTDDELTIRIDSSVDAAEMLFGQGHTEVAEMIMRSVAKARKQRNKRA